MMRLLCAVLLCGALPISAAEPLTGTWKEDLGTVKFSGKPEKIELSQVYKCLSCDPPVTVKADGKDQAVSGVPGIDTISVRIIDDHSIEMTSKKAGKIILQAKQTVSSNGGTLTTESTYYPVSSDKPVNSTTTSNRIGSSIAGMHALSGSWLAQKQSESENAKFNTFEQTADGLKWSAPTGEHYDAKLDGKEYPVAGANGWDKVVLKRIGANTVEETDKFGDKVLATFRYTVLADGRSMNMEIHDNSGGIRTSRLDKQ